MPDPAPEHRFVTSKASPRTRSDWTALADRLLHRAMADASPGHARMAPPTRLPGRRAVTAVDQLEGFARTFLLAGVRVAHPDPDAGDAGDARDEIAAWYRTGIAAGVDAASGEAWPDIVDHDQTLVEAAAVALGLHWSRDSTWALLGAATQERLVGWLSTGRHRTCADNNHVLLGATVQAFLRSVGAPYDPDEIELALSRIERWYRGDGWYTDGEGRRFDHYNAWTFHLYPWFIDDMPGGDTARLDLWRHRLRAFLCTYPALLGAGGRPVLQGRSLVYRWGVLGPLWLGAAVGASPLGPGATRVLAGRTVGSFLADGVASDGRLSLGWRGRESASLLQPYTMAGSPHWASKGMLGLLWPADHPLWSDADSEPPLRPVTSLAGPAWLAARTDGATVLLNHGSDGHPRHDSPWYRRLAYSDQTVPVAIGEVRDNAVVALPGVGTLERGSEVTWVDRGLLSGTAGPDWARSRRAGRLGERDVHTDIVSIVHQAAELRVIRVHGAAGLRIWATGFAVSADDPPGHTVTGCAARAATSELIASIEDVPIAAGCRLVTAEVVTATHDTALGPYSALGVLTYDVATGARRGTPATLAVLVRLGTTPDDEPAPPVVATSEDGVVVTWTDRVWALDWPGDDEWPADGIDQGVWRPWTHRSKDES